jgi:hypothetical protein
MYFNSFVLEQTQHLGSNSNSNVESLIPNPLLMDYKSFVGQLNEWVSNEWCIGRCSSHNPIIQQSTQQQPVDHERWMIGG